MSSNVIKGPFQTTIPEIKEREGRIILNFGNDREQVEIEGSITLSEACFLLVGLQKYIHETMDG